MADRGDTHYKTATLNKWFAFSSILLLFAVLWMVLNDAMRPWKQYQREFRQIEIARGREALATQKAQASMAEETRLEGVLEQKEKEHEAKSAELDEAQEVLRQLKGDQFVLTEAEKKAKQEFNFAKFQIEEERLHLEDPTYKEEELEAFEIAWTDANNAKKEKDAAVTSQEDLIKAQSAGIDDLRSEIKAAGKSVDLVRKSLAKIDPSDAPTRIANVIRDFPGLDFIGPSLKVKKVVLQDLTFELNFTTKKRIDMCETCHVAIDRAGFENEKQPFTSHPNLSLYLTATSPHAKSVVGCTICHRGAGEALDFVRADHRPEDEAEEKVWDEEHGWHKQHHWDYPMLETGMVEAGCVQCHKDSMEVIADDAPELTKGYRLFERYGCYACHKVEWFPTKRHPGPSLVGIKSKAPREFIDAWVTKPKSFRPTTWMPQIFHLSNYTADTVVTKSEYGQGREIMGDEWSNSAVAAVSEFIWSRAEETQAPPIPVEGDALRGREVFHLVGCLACHNTAPFTEAERAEAQAALDDFRYSDADLGQIAHETNEVGPNLRGVASKVKPEWLFSWIKDPKAYWSETRMPDLRLNDQDAADIVAYIFEDPEGVFHDTPEGWNMAKSPFKRDVLEEQARWFFNRSLPDELNQRFKGEWASDETLLQVVGEKFVLAQGCHSCHEIRGLEDAQPIGTELTNWGSKIPDKLDWGLMHEFIADEKGLEGKEAWHFKEQLRAYREPWLMQKLDNPRSFDREKVKNPIERLRMPWFGFTEDQRHAIATFVVGLVDDEVRHAKMIPNAAQASMDHGLRAIRQKNCAACHVIEPGSIDFVDDEGTPRSISGQFLAFEGEILPPSNEGIQDYIARFEDLIREVEEDPEFKVEDIAMQLLRPEPGLGQAGSNVVLENVSSVSAKPAWGGDFVKLVTQYYLYATGYDDNDDPISLTGDPSGESRVQDVDGEWRDYQDEPFEKIRWTFAPPVLTEEGVKLQREWFYSFLMQPYPLRQQIRVHMPTFNWNEGEAGAVADYFANAANIDWPARFGRKFLLSLGVDPAKEKDAAEEGLGALSQAIASSGLGAISPDQIRGIINGDKVAIAAQFSKLKAYADHVGFSAYGPNNTHYEEIDVRQPENLEPLLAAMPDYLERVHTLSAQGPNCFKCHYLQGAPPAAEGPIAWAPDLDNVRTRLRPDWIREWLTDPSRIYPGTSMPGNFALDSEQWQDLWPAPSREQIEAVTTWLFNLDRWAIQN